jgi:DNA polymerase III epsilon subunit-like protein
MADLDTTVYLDVETTGLYPPDDEILEIAIVDQAGHVLVQTLVQPGWHTAWPDAEAIHGITPTDVVQAPRLETVRAQIVEAVRGKTVVIYNAPFDHAFLPDELAAAAEVRCCMRAFAEHYGERSVSHGNYRWQTLTWAAHVVRHVYAVSGPHRALADALACRAVWRYLMDPAERARVDTIIQDEQLQGEATHYLRGWELEAQRARARFEARMTHWWQWWWLKQPPLEPARPRYDPRSRSRQDAYVQLFTGYATLVMLEQVERAEALGLPCYRRQRDIPVHLSPDRYFRIQTAAWVRAALRARAYYLSTSGRSFRWLYDTRDVETIRRQHIPRYEGAWPAHLATATQLRRASVALHRLAALQPVAEYYHPLAHCWYPLYECPPTSETTR